jgi:hypothetical protein
MNPGLSLIVTWTDRSDTCNGTGSATVYISILPDAARYRVNNDPRKLHQYKKYVEMRLKGEPRGALRGKGGGIY